MHIKIDAWLKYFIYLPVCLTGGSSKKRQHLFWKRKNRTIYYKVYIELATLDFLAYAQ